MNTRIKACRRAENIEKNGVNMPKHSDSAAKTKPPTIQEEFVHALLSDALMISVAAMETRKTKSAAPTSPVGNIENNLCTFSG
jgi:hypothetical protein